MPQFLLILGLLIPPFVAQANELPAGFSFRVSAAGDLVITIEEGKSVVVLAHGSGEKSPKLAATNKEGRISAIQLNSDGDVPVSFEIFSDDKTEIRFMRDFSPPIIIDENGDGLPNLKVEGRRRYKVKSIEWEEIRTSR